MTLVIKSVLMSALVCPGMGHVLLKHYRTGWALVCTTVILGLYLISTVIAQAIEIMAHIQNSGQQIDLNNFETLLALATNNSESHKIAITTFGLLLCWLVGVVDSFRVARRQATASKKT